MPPTSLPPAHRIRSPGQPDQHPEPASAAAHTTPHADNKLAELLDIPEPAPASLRTADFRRNCLTTLHPARHRLAAYTALTDLALDSNGLRSLAPLRAVPSLTQLTASHNDLTSLDGIEALTVRRCTGLH